METRGEVNDAARRQLQTVGQWLTETVQQRISGDRVTRLPNAEVVPLPAEAPRGSTTQPTIADLAELMRAMPGLVEAKGCGGVARAARRVVVQGLAAYMPPMQTGKRPSMLPGRQEAEEA